MIVTDVLSLFQWWTVLLLLGIVFLPITNTIFALFFDRGYLLAKTIALLSVSYTVFLLGTLRLLPFTYGTILVVIAIFAAVNGLVALKNHLIRTTPLRVILFEELLFLLALACWAFVRSHQPDIHGLEKYMDFGFVNSILRADYFPPKDMWFTPFSINYYYFGHLTTAVLTKLSLLPSSISYNLMIATLFALTFTGAFSIGTNLVFFSKPKARGDTAGRAPDPVERGRQRASTGGTEAEGRVRLLDRRGWKAGAGPRAILGGFLTAFLVSLAGNLHTIYAFFAPYATDKPLPPSLLSFSFRTFPNAYWYPNATRFIYNTIHEFPLYSFVVSDLHGHVLDIPFVLLTIAFLLQVILSHKLGIYKTLFLSFLLASLYMTNAWDGIIYAMLAIAIFAFINAKLNLPNSDRRFFALMVVLALGFFVFSLPFSFFFKPFVSGIGVLCAPSLLTNLNKVGPFLFEQDHCQRSPLWQLVILYGFFYFLIVSFLLFLRKRQKTDSDMFVLILTLVATILIVVPEFVYVKDIYPAHYRANTMFKLVYQSFIMLSLSSAYIIMKLIANLKLRYWKLVVFGIGSIGLFLVSTYPYFAINAYYGNVASYYGLDGLSYLKKLYPQDYDAIVWISKNVKGQPVILEAQGDSYTDFARVSANTGIPTVLGWTVHEWLWRGSYNVPSSRIEAVTTLYETSDITVAKRLIEKYSIALVFIGDLERQKYQNLKEEKFATLGTPLFTNGQTVIYSLGKL